jgi:hypothetical protein
VLQYQLSTSCSSITKEPTIVSFEMEANIKLKTKNTVAEYCRESQDANYENINQLLQGISYCKFSSITIMDLALKLPSTVLPNRFIRIAIMIHQRHGDNFHPQA